MDWRAREDKEHPSRAVKVEVLGSRFLTRFTHDDEAVAGVPWKLRFPRVVQVPSN